MKGERKKVKLNKICFMLCLILHTLGYTQSIIDEFKNIIDEFKKKAQKEYIGDFNKDLTGVVCNNIFNHADELGLFTAVPLSIGVNIKISGSAKKISDDNLILKDTFKNVGYIPFLVIQVEKGLPYDIDLVGRYSGYENYVFWSAGLKYKIISLPPLAPIFSVAIAGIYNKLEAKDVFEHTSQSYNLIVSIDKIPVVKPYIVAGIDQAEMKVDEKVLRVEPDKFASGMRYEIGLNISTLPFLYLTVGYSYIYNTEGLSLSLGMKF